MQMQQNAHLGEQNGGCISRLPVFFMTVQLLSLSKSMQALLHTSCPLTARVVQMEYPRTQRIRKRWLFRRIVELVVFIGLMLFLVDQYVEPAILNSIGPLRETSRPILVVERVLKLSLPCMYVWLTIFYVFFHLFLNVVRSASACWFPPAGMCAVGRWRQ